MPRLVDTPFEPAPAPLPRRVRDLIADADDRTERLHHRRRDEPLAAFVPCDYELAWRAVRSIAALSLAPGRRFAEWGSGAGVVTCLASLVGFDAVGIEIEQDLIDLAEGLAEDNGFDVEFACGSFIPAGGEAILDDQAGNLARQITWLASTGADAHEELGLDPDDFDLVFAYPWPGEEDVIFDLFAEHAAVGSLLLTHHGEDGLRLQRLAS